MTDIIANVDKKDVYTEPNTDYFKNFKFPKKKINKDGVVIDSTTLPEIKDINRSSKEPSIPDNDTTIEVNKLTTYHYLEAQKVKNNPNDSVKLIMVAPSPLKNPDDCVVEAIQDNNKVYTPFAKTANEFNNGLSKANDMVLFQSWLSNMESVFKKDATQIEKLEMAAKETLDYVPYLGQLLAVGRDLGHEDYKGALETIGITVLLYMVPQLSIPVMAGFKIYEEIKTIDAFDKTIDNVIYERNKRWHSVYAFMAHQWYENIHIQIKQRLNHIYQALSYQGEAIKQGVDKEHKKYPDQEYKYLRSRVANFNENIDKLKMKSMENAEEFLEKASLSYFEKYFLPKALEKLQEFDRDTRSKIEEFKNSSQSKLEQQGIGDLQIAMTFQINDSKINNAFRPIKFNRSLLTSLMNSDKLIDNIVLENDLTFNLGVKGGMIQDLSEKWTNLTIGTDTRVVHGRDNEAIRLNSTENSRIQIEKNSSLSFLNFNDFSLSFWIRVPRYNKFDKDKDYNNEYTLVNNMDTTTKGFKISIKNGILYWTLKGTQQKTAEIPLSNTKVSDNIWRHVTITKNKDVCTIYVDGDQKGSVSISGSGDITNTLPITLQLVGNKNKKQFIRLDQFNIYKKSLSKTEVQTLFNSYFKDTDIRDYWGEHLEYNKTYKMQNIAYKGCNLRMDNNLLSVGDKSIFNQIGENDFTSNNPMVIPRLYNNYQYDVVLQKDSREESTDIMPKANHIINIKAINQNKFIAMSPNVSNSRKTLKLAATFGDDKYDPKDFRLMSMDKSKKNWVQIKKEKWNTRNGAILIPEGLIGVNPNEEFLYLWSWDWDGQRNYNNDNWCFICKDEGWIDRDGNLENA